MSVSDSVYARPTIRVVSCALNPPSDRSGRYRPGSATSGAPASVQAQNRLPWRLSSEARQHRHTWQVEATPQTMRIPALQAALMGIPADEKSPIDGELYTRDWKRGNLIALCLDSVCGGIRFMHPFKVAPFRSAPVLAYKPTYRVGPLGIRRVA